MTEPPTPSGRRRNIFQASKGQNRVHCCVRVRPTLQNFTSDQESSTAADNSRAHRAAADFFENSVITVEEDNTLEIAPVLSASSARLERARSFRDSCPLSDSSKSFRDSADGSRLIRRATLRSFRFDAVFAPSSSQDEIFECVGMPVLQVL